LKIIQNTFEFNPFFRKSAATLLQSPIFDDIRSREQEARAPWKIKVATDESNAFDYESLRAAEWSSITFVRQEL